MTTLITGGAGYIGSHTIVELLAQGHKVIVADNFSNSTPLVFDRLKQITGHAIQFYEIDLRAATALNQIFTSHKIDAVIHFAGLKAVGESVTQPLRYYQNNLDSTLTLCEVMATHHVKQLVFSSSATVYGNPAKTPITEDMPLSATNPYGQTKLMIEQILRDVAASDPHLHITLLRYFNPIGAHASGLIGEDPRDIPNNLMPFITQVAIGRRPKLSVFGNDYPTPDGTCIRDYIHVVDLARGHVQALEHPPAPGAAVAYNLGTGKGYSVLEVIQAFEAASGRQVPYEIVARRPGDIAACFADATKAKAELDWQAQYQLADMCTDAWRWQSQNPDGYKR